MISFQKYFENRVEKLLENYTQQTFFVFRGFGIEQIKYLINHSKSILPDEALVKNDILNLDALEQSKKRLNKSLLLATDHIVGFYEELIAILSVVKDLSVSFDGKVVVINNNLFDRAVPSCLTFEQASNYFDYMQSDRIQEQDEMEQIGKYYSDVMILQGQRVLFYQNNVHKDLELEVVDLFDSKFITPGEYNTGEDVLIGTEQDLLYRFSVLSNNACPVNLKKDISGRKEETESLQKVLECLGIQYSLLEVDTKVSEFEYDDTQFVPYLKKYWGQNAKFRDLEFYKDPSSSKDIKVFSQGSLVSEIVEQCELAQQDDEFRDVFITAPTGAGKSLLFQLPALYIAEKYDLVTIVISPLIALMNDQVAQLELERGVSNATCINSSISFEERQQRIADIRNGKKSIIYLESTP